jgi:hypothetical protein
MADLLAPEGASYEKLRAIVFPTYAAQINKTPVDVYDAKDSNENADSDDDDDDDDVVKLPKSQRKIQRLLLLTILALT